MASNLLRVLAAAGGLLLFAASGFASPWVKFVDETGGRLAGLPEVGVADVMEKDYAWGDVDQDGDVDLVVARTQPFGTGAARSVLLLNEEAC